MVCTCTPLDIDAVVAAYYAHVREQEEAAVPKEEPATAPQEETTSVYWTGDPEATSTSVGGIDGLIIPPDGKIDVPVSVAVYLTSVQPKLFSPVPRAASAALGAAPESAPMKASSED